MLTLDNIVLVITATTTALVAGLFYSYSCSVNPGLNKLSDEGYLAAMKAINKAILNPFFFLSFIGTAFLLPLCCVLFYGHSERFLFLVAATVIYLAGVIGVTAFGNIPLNNAIEAFDLKSATKDAMALQRVKFEVPWNKLNIIRTIASIVSIILVIIACLVK